LKGAVRPPPFISAGGADFRSLIQDANTTTSVMLFGTPDEVEQAARKAIDDAAAGGGFILSTGDQCGRDTPDANLFKLVEVAKTYGCY
jgi:uroporphyrinogen decarboxylase